MVFYKGGPGKVEEAKHYLYESSTSSIENQGHFGHESRGKDENMED